MASASVKISKVGFCENWLFHFFLKPKKIHFIMNDFLRISHFSILKNITFFNGFYVYF
ncbi:hypothetical protein DB44_CW00630 [Candidatus Protochlamydia amoebophila]|uniref:Uncharacterized protein n=1 Tax=Candidatus Protochlamydia amoebophila TaxID=362787 RepID=A0A0C1JKS0_9BACT|nr:hypothetical protein DB44_CW00630 [Candidatus Protochlamydia amoebophila]